MALNNIVTLIGNLGADPRIHTTKSGLMATFSLATTDSYKDNENNWHSKPPVWHQIVAYGDELVSLSKNFTKGSRIEVKGSVSYQSFPFQLADGKTIQKKEASIIARKIQPAPLNQN